MRPLAVLVALVFVGSPARAIAATMAEVVGSAAVACMNNLQQPEKIRAVLSGGGVQLKPEHAGPFLKPHRGVAFLSKFDNGGEMMSGIIETGGCKIFSNEASREAVEKMLTEELKSALRSRLLGREADKDLLRSTYAVSFRGNRMFLRVFGSTTRDGAVVEIFPADRPPSTIPAEATIPWPD